MPIFEYVCKECNNSFEALVQRSTNVQCPSCTGTILEKQLSVFAASVKGESKVSSDMPITPCGACGDPRGPGACSMS
jgi:putative FmdB family regulatory protein